MADWAPVLIGVILFILLSPGLLFQLPGHTRHMEFGSFKTNGKSIVIHTLIFFAIFTILTLALHVHIYAGDKTYLMPYVLDIVQYMHLFSQFDHLPEDELGSPCNLNMLERNSLSIMMAVNGNEKRL
ncbi:hypothetical protein C5167_022355 [Papaver somniferum]|uniref:Transmembrane protein n=2 Tax=Papaver TaxID=3468 RepID=A0A4Y7JIL2_PAPSO|nr:hypothetical protein C5167_022355 [Papaver somniferum]